MHLLIECDRESREAKSKAATHSRNPVLVRTPRSSSGRLSRLLLLTIVSIPSCSTLLLLLISTFLLLLPLAVVLLLSSCSFGPLLVRNLLGVPSSEFGLGFVLRERGDVVGRKPSSEAKKQSRESVKESGSRGRWGETSDVSTS